MLPLARHQLHLIWQTMQSLAPPRTVPLPVCPAPVCPAPVCLVPVCLVPVRPVPVRLVSVRLVPVRLALLLVCAFGLVCAGPVAAQAPSAAELMNTLVAHETDAGKVRGHYTYFSDERSDRTGGHLWSEKVVETQWGKIAFLLQEDGKPLTLEREAAERGRLAAIVRDPEAFKRADAARVDDEQHAKQMLTLLPRAFLFDGPSTDGDVYKINFRPNPSYQPQGLEEKVLHGMSGTVAVDRSMIRLRAIEGHMPQDVSLGFGLLATIKAGSNFSTVREHVLGPDWKTESVHTAINGKALFLKTIARSGESQRRDYKKVADNISIQDAVALIEQ